MRRFAYLTMTAGLVALTALPASAQSGAANTVSSSAGDVAVESLADGLNHPWGMAFLPNGDLLVTERAGQLRVLGSDGTLSQPVEGTPEVFARGQGGLLDVALDPDFAENSVIWLSFSDPGEGGASTALGRGTWQGGTISGFETIFVQEPKIDGSKHFGGRIAFDQNGQVFLTMGERFQFEPAQDLSNHLGTVARIDRDGSIPEDNPFATHDEAQPEIWSYGHRNIEAAAVHPETGALWVVEMGPRGGDELNRPEAGRNYGWPVVSWGENYDGTDIPDPPTQPQFADAVMRWTPVISPSGMAFYTGDMFADWQGSALVGGLSSRALIRITIDGDTASEAERLEMGMRIRDVEQASDGAIYLLTDEDNGQVLRLTPAS